MSLELTVLAALDFIPQHIYPVRNINLFLQLNLDASESRIKERRIGWKFRSGRLEMEKENEAVIKKINSEEALMAENKRGRRPE